MAENSTQLQVKKEATDKSEATETSAADAAELSAALNRKLGKSYASLPIKRDLNHGACIVTDISNLFEILTDLVEFLTEWRPLGGALGLSEGSLKVVKNDNNNEAQNCMRGTLSLWLSGNGHDASLKTLIDALNEPLVKGKDIADKIKAKAIKNATDQN